MAADAPTTDQKWAVNVPQVRKAIAFIKRRPNGVTAEELVAWDLAHGRRLFNWEDADAAGEWRKHEARLFLNRFRAKFEGMRVRAFIHVHEDAEADIPASAYHTVESIADHPGMRDQVIKDIAARMKVLASELAMWKLSQSEQQELFDQLRDAMDKNEKLRKTA